MTRPIKLFDEYETVSFFALSIKQDIIRLVVENINSTAKDLQLFQKTEHIQIVFERRGDTNHLGQSLEAAMSHGMTHAININQGSSQKKCCQVSSSGGGGRGGHFGERSGERRNFLESFLKNAANKL